MIRMGRSVVYDAPNTPSVMREYPVRDEEAAPLNCGVATMISITEAAVVNVGDTVVVQGLGLLGLYGCAIAKARGARRVIGLGSAPDPLAIAAKFGADAVFDIAAMNEDDLVAAVRAECPPDGADCGIEVCGAPAADRSVIRAAIVP